MTPLRIDLRCPGCILELANVGTRVRQILGNHEFDLGFDRHQGKQYPDTLARCRRKGVLLRLKLPGSSARNFRIARAHQAPAALPLWIGQIVARIADMTRARGLLPLDRREPRRNRHLLETPSPRNALLFGVTGPGIFIRNPIAKLESPAYLRAVILLTAQRKDKRLLLSRRIRRSQLNSPREKIL